ncbi:hypothetical protein PoB_003129200 [Plakobranchus ocellatus]|uniref:Uncharacterized protein n=1 Tax=Plakobranchus ocellatus TaxID=259542 RepID=A0AAV4ACN4_9GAST|nr:hypothetical protein PoB_003129200 [Plakobranchus ocellatus]
MSVRLSLNEICDSPSPGQGDRFRPVGIGEWMHRTQAYKHFYKSHKGKIRKRVKWKMKIGKDHRRQNWARDRETEIKIK